MGDPKADPAGRGATAPVSLRRNFSWTVLGEVVYAGCQWAVLVVLAKLGTPELVGQFALGLAVTAPVVMFTNLQLRALQATDPTPGGNFAPYFTLRLLASGVAVLIVGALALRASPDPTVRAGVVLVGLAKAVEAVSDIFHGRLQQTGNLKWVCISMTLKGLLSLAAVAAAVSATGRLVPVCLLLLASWLAVLLAVDVPCVARAAGRRGPGAWRSVFALCLEPPTLKRLFVLGLGLGLTAMLISLKVSVPRFALEEYWQDRAVGVYAALASLMQLSNLPAAALGIAASSRLGVCFAGNDWPRLRRLLVGLLAVSFLFGAVGLALALVAGRLLLTVFYSAEYAAAHEAFTWLMVAALAGNVCCILNWAVLARATSRARSRCTWASCWSRRGRAISGCRPGAWTGRPGPSRPAARRSWWPPRSCWAMRSDPSAAAAGRHPSIRIKPSMGVPVAVTGLSGQRLMSVAADNGRCRHGAVAALGFYFLACTANLVFAGACASIEESRAGLALYGMCVASVVWLVIAWGSWYGATGRLADAYWLLALAVWLFNGGGMALTQLVHPDPDWAFRAFASPVTRRFTLTGVVRAFHFVLFGLSAMHAGALLAVSRRPAGAAAPVAAKDPSLFWIGLGLLVVSAGPALWMVKVSMARVRAGGYMALYQEDGGAGEGLIFMLSSGLVPGAFYLMGSDLDNRWLRRAGGGLVVAFSAAVLALGTRALFFQNLVALLWLRHFGVRPIRKAVWAGLVVAGLLLSGFVAWSREKARQSELVLSDLRPAAGEANAPGLASSLNEMGTSVVTVVFTMDLVPAVRDFAWGETYLASLAAVIPGLDTRRETEEVWLTYLVSPETASIGGGLGFSFMAEAYLNFGIAAPVVLGLAGFFLGGFAGWSHAAGRSGRLAFAACVISIMLFSARASSLSFVRRVLMLCVIPYAALVVLQLLEARYAGPRRNCGV